MTNLLNIIAKWDERGNTHPLVYHMIDSGVMALTLWQGGLSPGIREQICTWLNLDEEAVGQLIAYWTSLHDIGKASCSFQKKCDVAIPHLKQEGYPFPPLVDHDVRHHSLLSAWILDEKREQLFINPDSAILKLLLALAGHHGKFPHYGEFIEDTFREANLGTGVWTEAQSELVTMMQDLFSPPIEAYLSDNQSITNAFFNIVTGLFITADWLSSNTNLFRYHAADLSPERYLEEISRPAAHQALHNTGWGSWQPEEHVLTFKEIFPDYTPNLIQQAVLNELDHLTDPFFMILESTTGSGKTEIALTVADTWIQKHRLSGFYIAMPTQATSDQMFDRVTRYLQGRYPGKTLNLQLAHGSALLKEEYEKMQLAGIADDEENATSGVNALSWFTPSKLTLLAPFGVGTVDQAFLSVLQTRHFALRLFGLARKVVIFDEVHAYDVYMVEIFKRLLPWLRAIGTSVILLSATLPRGTREELLTAFNPDAHINSSQTLFPRLSLSSGDSITCKSLGTVANRKVNLEHIDHQPESILTALQQKMVQGGCAGVICNTVKRAQEVYAVLKNSRKFKPEDVILFHSHFPFCWREDRQNQVLKGFGRLLEPALEYRHKIVVATQIIEQSLDLDFDLLISDLAPLDLLIQRIGRLQRHSAMPCPPQRPAVLSEPTCMVAFPNTDAGGMPQFTRADCLIYDPVFLQRSHFLLSGRRILSLPEDSDELIEGVYSDADLPDLSHEQNQIIHALYQKMKRKSSDEAGKAENHLIADVDFADLFSGNFDDLSEEDPTVHQDLQALARDIRPSVSFVCLTQEKDGRLYSLDGHHSVDLETTPEKELTKALLRSKISVSDFRVVIALHQVPLHAAWKRSAKLRYLRPLCFIEGHARISDEITCTLDPEFGFQIENESTEE